MLSTSTFFAPRPNGTLLCLYTRDPDVVRRRLLAIHRAPACGLLRKPDGKHLALIWADDALARILVRAALRGHGSLIDWPGRLVVEDWEGWYGRPHTVAWSDPQSPPAPDWLRALQTAEELQQCAP